MNESGKLSNTVGYWPTFSSQGVYFPVFLHCYSLIDMRQLHIVFNSAKTWHVIVCWFLCFPPNLPELSLKLFGSNVENNFRFSSDKFGGKHRNQQTIKCQVLAELNKIWSSLIFIKLYYQRKDWKESNNQNLVKKFANKPTPKILIINSLLKNLNLYSKFNLIFSDEH